MSENGQPGDIESLKALKEEADRFRRWKLEKSLAESFLGKWKKRCKVIAKEYSSEGSGDGAKFNVLWSTHNILKPNVFSGKTEVVVERRNRDRDSIARQSSFLLERATQYNVDSYGLDNAVVSKAVDNFLLFQLGVAWVRYVPVFELEDIGGKSYDSKVRDITQDVVEEDEERALIAEEVRCEFVDVEDFLFSPASTWEEVRWVARRIPLTRDAIRVRFGEKKAGKFNYTTDQGSGVSEEDEIPEAFQLADIWEFWDKEQRMVYWMSPQYKEDRFIDEIEDPLGLKDFFPCPKPMFITTAPGSLEPIPDYVYFQDQAKEIDTLTTKILLCTDALNFGGAYNGEFVELQNLFAPTVTNKFISIDNWMQFAEMKGFDGNMDFLPVGDLTNVLNQLINIRRVLLQDVAQIIGIPDVLRGTSVASESARAQSIKVEAANVRLAEKKKEIERFRKELVAIKAEIIAEKFSPNSILYQAGITAEEHGEIVQNVANIIGFLRTEDIRDYRITVETSDSIYSDEEAEKERRLSYLDTIGRMMDRGLQISQAMPDFGLFMLKGLLWASRAFRVGRSLESGIEQAIYKLEEQLNAPPPPPSPSPEEMKLQAEMQIAQAKQELEQFKVLSKKELDEFKAVSSNQLKQEKEARQRESEQFKMMMEAEKQRNSILNDRIKLMTEAAVAREKAIMESETKIQIAGNKQKTDFIQNLISSLKESGAVQSEVTTTAPAKVVPDTIVINVNVDDDDEKIIRLESEDGVSTYKMRKEEQLEANDI